MDIQQAFVQNLLAEITRLTERAVVAETLYNAEKEKVEGLEAQTSENETPKEPGDSHENA